MIKLLKGLFKLIEGILFIFLPIVVFYWSLTLINLDVVRPFITILGSFIDPLILPFKSYLEYKITYENDYTVDYTILFFAVMILCTAFIFTLIGRILDFINNIIEKIQNKIKMQDVIRKKQEEKQAYINEVTKNNTIYVVLKLTRNQTKEAYLIKSEDADFFSVGLVDSYESSLKNVYKKFNGKNFGRLGGTNGLNNYIFTDINKFLEYLPFFMERIEEVNKGMQDLNIKFSYEIACHCSYSDASAQVDLDITSTILNLCGDREILLSELLKSRLGVTENKTFKLYSRGIYLIKDKQMDVFKFKLV
ncbi:MAG: hypothetical protein A2039_02735 [Candidatus Melainabacteria bacterium GWA2_34_9]|nr:MAG: hypothetical protein A2039_02735 [Candidatus Melainabacteria bacterium GWA2_34_9]